jgi:hypothetical protein
MIVDGWVNLFPEAFASRWAAKDEQKGVLAAACLLPLSDDGIGS